MRKIILFTAAFVALISNSQDKINLKGLCRIEAMTERISRGSFSESTSVEALVTMEPGWSDERFADYSAEIVESVTDNLLIVRIPVENIIAFSQLDDVFYIEYGNEYNLTLNFARPASNVEEIQNGFTYNDEIVSFTGKGIVTGLMDNGIDPNHINFNGSNGRSRVLRVYDFDNNKTITNSLSLGTYQTDDKTQTHGTHVAGIMCGSYNGNGKYVQMSSPSGTKSSQITGPIPFYGVATGSDIVMCAGRLTDTNIIKGVKNIVEYGKSVGKPTVVNLSIGSNDGPHDGTTSLDQGIKAYASDGIICVSSGNEGDSPMFVGKSFTESQTELKTFVKDNQSSGIDIWSNSSEPLTVTVALYSTSDGSLTEVAKITGADQSKSSSESTDFTSYYTGSFSMRSSVNRLNNRFNVLINGSFKQAKGGRNVALIVEGKPGQQVYVYGYGDLYTSFTSNGEIGYTSGTTDGTINGLACASEVIAVGAYTTRTTWGTFYGYGYYNSNTFKVDEVSPFSSYGTNFQGDRLPVICAPGANIISSLNRYYTKDMTADTRDKSTSAEAGSGVLSYWGAMQGTSMSCPYVAGTVALWLEADPSLSVDDVKDILKQTAIIPGNTGLATLLNKQWGGGKLDALAGIKEVLRRKSESGGIDGVLADAGGYVISPVGDRSYNVVVDGAGAVTATLYNMQGVAVARADAQGNEVTISADGVQGGVYILAVDTPNAARISRRILLK